MSKLYSYNEMLKKQGRKNLHALTYRKRDGPRKRISGTL
jgi:hypothetical protein